MGKKKKRTVEWSVDFENIGDKFRSFFEDFTGDWDGDVELKHATFKDSLEGATSADVKLNFTVAHTTLRALAETSGNLIEADVDYVGEIEFEADGSPNRRVKLRQEGKSFFRGRDLFGKNKKEVKWDIRLTQKLPIALRIKGGVGKSDLDLTGLNLRKLKLNSGVGEMKAIFPVQDETLDVDLKAGVGKTHLVIPSGIATDISIKGGVGEVIVDIAPDVALRVEASTGMGETSVPKHLNKVKGGRNFFGGSGIWETDNFAQAERQVHISFKGGIGSFKVRTLEMV